MNKFEIALEECLASMQLGDELDECLKRYPQFSAELRPLLQAAKKLEFAGAISPTSAFKTSTRSMLGAHMRAHPRRPVWRRPTLVARYAASLAVLVLTFATTGFALAQNSLPGQFLYSWKIASERVWRGLHVNPVYVDVELTQRRLQELLAIQNDPDLAPNALAAYADALRILEVDVNLMPQKATHAREALDLQKQIVTDQLGSSVTDVDGFFIIIPNLQKLIEENPQEVEPTDSQLELPLLLTPLATAGKKLDEGNTDESEENWLDDFLSNLLGE